MFWLGRHTGWRLLDLPWVRAGLELPAQPARGATGVPRFLIEQNWTGDRPSSELAPPSLSPSPRTTHMVTQGPCWCGGPRASQAAEQRDTGLIWGLNSTKRQILLARN